MEPESKKEELTLRSPMGTSPMIYSWPLKKGKGSLRRSEDKQDEAAEIVDTIRWVCEDISAIKEFMDSSNLLNIYNPNSFESMTELCNTYNKAVEKYVINDLPSVKDKKTEVSRAHLRHIIQKCYNKSVTDPNLLNHYEAFTPEVYGETSFELICQILDKLHPIGPENKFVDLGSGVGQVVLQVAALSDCSHCLGIEKSNIPAKYAQDLEKGFRFWMGFYGKKYSDFKIVHGDFLDKQYRSEILESTIVFVNNFAFGPEVDQQLKYIFAELNDGARIFSSKSFCALNFRISERNLSDIGTIMHVSKMDPLKGSVSWTGKPVSYYLHVIDRAKLERFFLKNAASKKGAPPQAGIDREQNKKKLQLKNQEISDESTSRDSRSSSVEREPQDMTTTRKAWSEQIKSEQEESSTTPPVVTAVKTRRKGPRRSVKVTSKVSENNLPPVSASSSYSTSASSMSSNASSNSSSPPLPPPPPPPPPVTPELEQPPPPPPSRPVRTVVANAAAISALEGQEEHDFLDDPPHTATVSYKRRATRVKKPNVSTSFSQEHPSPSESPDEKTKRRSRSTKISGLDFLHNQTLNSIKRSNEDRSAPSGCINLRLEKSTNPQVLEHEEIPVSLNVDENGDPISYELKLYLQKCKKNFLDFINTMKDPHFKNRVNEELAEEKKKNIELLARKKQLKTQVDSLLDESLDILKVRLRELGIPATSPPEFIEKAKEIVSIHHELQNNRKNLEGEVNKIQEENDNLISSKEQELIEQLSKLKGFSNTDAKNIIRNEIDTVVKNVPVSYSNSTFPSKSDENIYISGPITCSKKIEGATVTPLLNKLSDVTFTKCPPPEETLTSPQKRSKDQMPPKHRDLHRKRQISSWNESVTIEPRPYEKANIISPGGVEVRRIDSPAVSSYDISPSKQQSSSRLVDLPKIDLAQSMQAVNNGVSGSRADITLQSHPDSRSNSSEHIDETNFAKSKVCTTPRAEQFQDRLKTIIHSVLSADEDTKSPRLPLPSVQHQKRIQNNIQPPHSQSSRTMNDLIQSEIEKTLSTTARSRPSHYTPPSPGVTRPQHSSVTLTPQQHHSSTSSMSRMSRVIEDSIRSQIESNDLEGLACPRSSRSPDYYKRDYSHHPQQQRPAHQQQQIIPPSYQMEGLAARYYEQSRKRSTSPTLASSAVLPPKKQHLDERSSSYRQCGISPHNSLPPKEETQKRWQDEISTGFDRLVAYATEVVDKRRKSSDSSSPGHLNSPSIGDQRKEIVLVSTQPSPEFDNRMSTLGVKFKGAGYRDKSGPPLMSPPGSSMTTNRIPTPNERIPTPGSTSSRAATPASSQGSRVPTPRSKSPLPGENLPEHHPKKRYFAESRMSAASSNNENLLDGRRTSNNDPYGRYYNNPGGGDPYSLPQQQQPQMMNPSTGSTR
uniref:Histone-lysine N-methyltransferase, H3 lysine-79 specific n=1 Tax=Lepeophtheirus salmonis TaxID=72036 RepID=A0A0K2TNK4_LEPSM